MIEISLLTGEVFFAGLWLLGRGMIWIRQKKIVWKREAVLLLMYVNLAIQPLRINLIPFVNILDYESRREAAINIVGNLSMFIPTGVLLPILYKRLDRFWKVLLAGAGLSFVIEMLQLLFPGSVTDLDDLILNTAGAAIGYGIYKLACRFGGKA